MRKARQNVHVLVHPMLCHAISLAITIVLAIFAADGATSVWPTHPLVACGLAVLCSLGAGIGHMRFCQQCGVKRPTQSRLLLGALILIFGTVSVTLGAIAEYRESETQVLRARDAGDTVDEKSIEETVSELTRTHSTVLVVLFFSDLRHGSPEALVPFCIGCFLELLPLATLLLMVRKKCSIRPATESKVGGRLRIANQRG